ncbi:MAG: hypothetical protein LBR67_08790 [Dysgonamonadaceae bacterium]|jgi:hypothetical protein|nr:hypothetical protein [Dysgonamonadaceae bacterium]
MKKIATNCVLSVLMVLFFACGGEKKKVEAPVTNAATEELKKDTTAAQPVDAETALAAYEKYVTGFVDVIKKMKAGDTKVIPEYSNYSQQLQQQSADMARYQIDFSPAQLKRWEKAKAKLEEALKSLDTKKK